MVRFAKLPLPFDVKITQAELSVAADEWQPHFNKYHYTGLWTVLALRSPGGNHKNIIPELLEEKTNYQNTVYMDHFVSVAKLLSGFKCEINAVRFLNLQAGAVIKEHTDNELAFEKGEARLHFPVITNPDVEFYCENERIILQEGECWYLNANLKHKVSNNSDKDRIHLVIDCKVNDWLKNLIISSSEISVKQDDNGNELLKIVKELRMQNTATSNKLADQMEERMKQVQTIRDNERKDLALKNWIPYKTVKKDGQIQCHWLNTFDKSFSEPFFDETILKCITLNRRLDRLKSVSDLEIMKEWATGIETVTPTAFIFHISRCGSTLVSQMLGTSKKNISLAEVPFFDELLRLSYNEPGFDQTITSGLLTAAIKHYAQKRTGQEEHLFIKTDSWHIFFYEQLKALYPDVPFILIYRDPNEVFNSHKKLRGIQTVPGLIEPELLGFRDRDEIPGDTDEYIAEVLSRYLKKYLEIIEIDNRCLLINYNEEPMPILQKIIDFTGVAVDSESLMIMEERSHYHSKKPDEVFAEIKPLTVPKCMDKAMELYDMLEKKRMNL